MQRLELKATVVIAVVMLFGISVQAQSLLGIKVGEEVLSVFEIDARPLSSKCEDLYAAQRFCDLFPHEA